MAAPFPLDAPNSLDSLDAIATNDWLAFTHVSEMVDHWDRPGWRSGRQSYHWILSFVDNDELMRLADQCRHSYRGFAFDPVPLDALHLTIRRVGFTDEIHAGDVDEVLARAVGTMVDFKEFALSVGPLAASRGAVRFTVGPWTSLFQLHDTLCASTEEVFGKKYPRSLESFRPHVSIAYSNAWQPANPVRAKISRHRSIPSALANVTAVELVELRREAAAYRWTTLGRIALSPIPERRRGATA